jgi:hypothetical protein
MSLPTPSASCKAARHERQSQLFNAAAFPNKTYRNGTIVTTVPKRFRSSEFCKLDFYSTPHNIEHRTYCQSPIAHCYTVTMPVTKDNRTLAILNAAAAGNYGVMAAIAYESFRGYHSQF